MLLIKESSFFEAQQYFLCFSTFWMVIFTVVLTLIIVVKLDAEFNVSRLSNVVNINVELDNVDVDLTLFNIANVTVDIHNIVSTLIWHCPTSQRQITLTATLWQWWKVSWVLPNVAKRLHNFVRSIKLKTDIFTRIRLNCCFCNLSKRYWWSNFGLKKKV